MNSTAPSPDRAADAACSAKGAPCSMARKNMTGAEVMGRPEMMPPTNPPHLLAASDTTSIISGVAVSLSSRSSDGVTALPLWDEDSGARGRGKRVGISTRRAGGMQARAGTVSRGHPSRCACSGCTKYKGPGRMTGA